MRDKAGLGFFLADLTSNLLVVFLILFALITIAARDAGSKTAELSSLPKITITTGKDFVDTLLRYDQSQSTSTLYIEIAAQQIRASQGDWRGRSVLAADQTVLCTQLEAMAKMSQSIAIFVLAEQSLARVLKSECVARQIPRIYFVPAALRSKDGDWSEPVIKLLGSGASPDRFRARLLRILEGGQNVSDGEGLPQTHFAKMSATLAVLFRWADFILSGLAVILILRIGMRPSASPAQRGS